MAIDGNWEIVMRTPLGRQVAQLRIQPSGDGLVGEWQGALGSGPLSEVRVDGDLARWNAPLLFPKPGIATFTASLIGDTLSGTVDLGLGTRAAGRAPAPFIGTRA